MIYSKGQQDKLYLILQHEQMSLGSEYHMTVYHFATNFALNLSMLPLALYFSVNIHLQLTKAGNLYYRVVFGLTRL